MKIQIKVLDDNDNQVIKAECLSIESAEEELGEIERYMEKHWPEAFKEKQIKS